MTIETEGVTTRVLREYEASLGSAHIQDGFPLSETPALADVTQAVAAAAVTAHRITPKE